jgi:hypothetical protein
LSFEVQPRYTHIYSPERRDILYIPVCKKG